MYYMHICMEQKVASKEAPKGIMVDELNLGLDVSQRKT